MNLDRELLLEIKNGNTKSLEIFFKNSHARLVTYARSFMQSQSIAEDIVQEAFIHFWNKRVDLKTESSIEALIFTSVKNRCLNSLRDQNVYQHHLATYTEEKKTLQELSELDFLGETESKLKEKLITGLEKSLQDLPEKCGKVFLMNKLEGKTQKEIADELDISQKAVEKHIAKAKAKLRLTMKSRFLLILAMCYCSFKF